MSETKSHRRSGGRDARRAARLHAHLERTPYLTRKLAPFEVLGEEGLATIEANADTILEEVGIEFRGDPDAVRLLADAGADVDGERVRFPRGMCRRIVQASAPRQFTQYARNPANHVEIGGPHTVFAPNYGSPFVHDLDRGRRYATLTDFENFVKLAYLSPNLHHSGGTVCEPVDLPANKRHLDMLYAHIRWSDRAFMGAFIGAERADPHGSASGASSISLALVPTSSCSGSASGFRLPRTSSVPVPAMRPFSSSVAISCEVESNAPSLPLTSLSAALKLGLIRRSV